MSYGDTWEQASLDTLFGISTYSAPSTGCAALHFAPPLETDAAISATTAVIGYQPDAGSEMTFKPRTTAETHYAGTVTDNGDGTYTITLEDSGGNASTISSGFSKDDYVEVEPAETSSRLNEPTDSSGYSRYTYPNDSSGWTRSGSEVTNDTTMEIGPATADWGLLTHAVYMSDETGGDLWAASKASKYKEYSDEDGWKIYPGMFTVTQD